jgi:non-specific serine/threonine protein kinase
MLGETISHYRIIEKLGKGGMGVVYRALDTKLDREVAIKFLPAHLSCNPDATIRFVHEAKAASAIDHSHIGTIYEIDETDDGVTFIVMALYEGETLRERMNRGEISVDEALDIASQIASGLSKAHEKNIVHRDIKPSNIIVTSDGEVKIIDFGLAKLAGRTRLTKEASTLGTAAYMSPEQARGEEVDHRSDIFSLGVILYEMLAGEPPFKGEHEAAILYEIVHEEPHPLSDYRQDLNIDYQEIIDKSLQKKADSRYSTISEMLSYLEKLKGVTRSTKDTGFQSKSQRKACLAAALTIILVFAVIIISKFYLEIQRDESEPERIMVAVLPFRNLGSAEDEYFADGLTEAITSRLAGIRGLGVISRQSVMKYKGSNENLKTIGEELGVEYILEGTVQRERTADPGSRVLITPQLIKVSNDTHMWAETYDDDLRELFDVQAEISEKVARSLDIELQEAERYVLAKKPTSNIEAYEYFLRGHDHYIKLYTEMDALLAEELFEKAISLDQEFALAYAELGAIRVWKFYSFSIFDDLQKAKTTIDRAFLIDPDLPEAYIALGLYYYWGFKNYDEALEQFEIASKLRPSEYEAHRWIGAILRRQGRWEELETIKKITFKLNPEHVNAHYGRGQTRRWLRDYADSEYHLNKAILLAPDYQVAYAQKALLYISWDGNIERAKQIMLDAMSRVDTWLLLGVEDWYINRILGRENIRIFTKLNEARIGVDSVTYYLSKANMLEFSNYDQESFAYYDSARAVIERKIAKEQYYNPMMHSYLGIAYAALGRMDEAIREGERGIELIPRSKDALDHFQSVQVLAEIYVRAGRYEDAIDQLDFLLSTPSDISIGLLELDPIWDPLRAHPSFQKLINKKSH